MTANGGWLPIETAPKDGRVILASLIYDDGGEELSLIRWDNGDVRWPWAISDAAFSRVAERIPAFWAPIPSRMKAMG